MFLRIETISPKKLVGMHLSMSLANNKTFELWNAFMPRRKEIVNCIQSELISMQVYDTDQLSFNPQASFEKWATVEVSTFEKIPIGMEAFELPQGLYAIFLHRGPANEGYKTFQYIFGTWLPQSEYELDYRPHFEVLGAKYKNNEADSEEEIFIPIKLKIKG